MRRTMSTFCAAAALAMASTIGTGCDRAPHDTLPLPGEATTARGDARTASSLELPSGTSASYVTGRAKIIPSTIGDAALVAQLRDKLSASTDAEGRAVSVRASDGVVVLTGQVSSERAKESAEEIAHDVDGVAQVDNRIFVARLPVDQGTRIPSVQ